MTKYIVSVEEKLYRAVIVEAENEEEAWSKLNDAYSLGNFMLTGDDWVNHDIDVEREADELDVDVYDNLEDYL